MSGELESHSHANDHGGKPYRILIADDEKIVLAFLRTALTGAGFEVESAENGQEAISMLRRETFDLLITDLVMPQMEGLELIMELRSRLPSLPIIAVSGAFGGVFLKSAVKFGAKAALHKPFSVEELLKTVREVLRLEA